MLRGCLFGGSFKISISKMADEDLSLNEDQLLDNLDEANGEHEAELMNDNEVSTCKILKSLCGIKKDVGIPV